MNHEVLYLVAVFVVGCTAITFRAILFNLAGERFVARLRKQVPFLVIIIIVTMVYNVFNCSCLLPLLSKNWDSLIKTGTIMRLL